MLWQIVWRRRSLALTGWFMSLAVCLQLASPAAASKPAGDAPASKWVRLLRDKAGKPLAMQTAVVRYVPSDDDHRPLSVDLIGAVHVGDRSYYDQLNRDFEQYDALLYELVAPPGTIITKQDLASNGNPIRTVQSGMKSLLDLDHQLECIDYTKENFVHADMSPEEFVQAMKDRDESFAQLIFRMIGRGIAQQSKLQAKGRSTDSELFFALFSKHRAIRLKTIMAEQFENMESMLVGLGGPNGTTLIAGRNQAALDVLRQQIRDGKKNIGIFYGAGHLTDMDKRLRRQFHLKPINTRWLTAWDLREKP